MEGRLFVTALVYCLTARVALGEYINLGQQLYVHQTGQSSTYSGRHDRYGPNNAIDGNINLNVDSYHCALQRDEKSSAYWKIEFKNKVHIDHIVIYHAFDKHAGNLRRFRHSRVYVSDSAAQCSGKLVYTQETDPTASRPWQYVFNISVNAVGKYLSVCQNAYPFINDDYINTSRVVLCEVIIVGCPYGKYGDQCGLTCGNCYQATCSLSTGTCSGECEQWYMGPMCDKLCGLCTDYSCNKDGCTRGCVDGKYGVYCDLSCPVNCSSKTCQRNGHCAGCVDGMYSDQCNATCPENCKENKCAQDNGACNACDTGHGQFCELQCPTNCESRACSQTDGACVGMCVDGFWGEWCNVTCPGNCAGGVCNKSRGQCDGGCLQGHWGDECRHECSSGCKDSVCAQSDGDCTAGCTVEFYGSICTQRCGHCADGVCDRDTGSCGGVCEEGYWGANCDLDCPTNCLNSTCTMDGLCNVGCKDGYRGQTCTDECEDGRYGTNCSSQCGKCRGGDGNCLPVDGTCLLGCSESYLGDSCHSVAEPVTQDDVTVPVVGGVVGALAVAVVVVVLIIVMRSNSTLTEPQAKAQHGGEVTIRPGGEVTVRSGGEVTIRPGGDVGAVYVNSAVSTNDDNNYYNMSSVPRGVLIDDLKEFIASRSTTDFTKLFKEIPYGSQFPHSAGQREENELKNRFRNLYAYDHSRVHLGGSLTDPNSDYINANYIDGCESERDYIASQGPKPNTLEDTWRMVVQEKCGKIVMLTNLLEGKSKKCERYWPLPGENVTYGDITLTLASEEERSFYTIRTINVRDTTDKKTETMIVQQFHFTAWPDHGVADPRQLVVFHRRVTQTNTSLPGPLLVHCSAGIGRTGTFIGLDALVTNGRLNKRIDISGYVAKMRRNRMNMVQTAAQFQLLHEALYEALMYPGSSIPRAEFVRRHGRLQRQIQKEFQILKNMSPAYLPDVYSEAQLDKNSRKNRNPSILPSNDHRVILSLGGGLTDNYINAVAVSGSVQNTQFLVTQLPLPDTTLDFWRMVCDHDSNVVVLLNPRDSDGKYSNIPPTGDQVIECGHFTIKFSSSHTVSSNIKESFAMIENKKNGTRQEVKLLYTTSWLNEELPPSSQLILDLIENVNNWQIQKGVHPITVQCLEGVLCSGLYCAVSKLIQQIRVDQEVDVFQAVREMQICRPEFIQSEVSLYRVSEFIQSESEVSLYRVSEFIQSEVSLYRVSEFIQSEVSLYRVSEFIQSEVSLYRVRRKMNNTKVEKLVEISALDESFEEVQMTYKCDACLYTTKYKQNCLYTRRHTIYRKCGSQFKTKQRMLLHVKSNNDMTFKYRCSTCQRGFNVLWNYRGHLSSHDNALKEKCSACGAKFSYKKSLVSHSKVCGSKQSSTFECKTCKKGFIANDALLQHIRGMHSRTLHTCKTCRRSYRWRSSLAYQTDNVCVGIPRE
ncbi:hypothetical protein ScPMuIL_015363 [Solemya velum]